MESGENLPVYCDKLTKRFGDTVAVDDVGFSIAPGEFFGLLGPNGAGKTTLINMLIGLATPSSGTAYVYGENIIDDYKQAHRHVGFAPAEENLDREFSIWDNLKFHGGYCGVPKKERERRAEEQLKRFDLWNWRNEKSHALSTGMRKKLLFARALISQPDLVILDEPTAGLDVETKSNLHRYINKIVDQGVTILFTTHQLQEAEQLCDRVAIMDKGRIIAIDDPRELMRESETDLISIQLEDKLADLPPELEGNGFHFEIGEKGRLLRAYAPKGDKAAVDILNTLFASGIETRSVDIKKASLEDVFLRLTREGEGRGER